MGAQDVSLSATHAAALADGFQPLEAAIAGLPQRLLRYVIEGGDDGVLLELATLPNAAILLGMDLSWGGLPPPTQTAPLPAWDALLEHSAEVPIPVFLRFAKTLSAVLGPGKVIVHVAGQGAFVHQSVSALQSLSPPSWLELLVRLGARRGYSPGISPIHKNRLSAETIERMLDADGYSPDLLYSRLFPESRHDYTSTLVVSLLGGLAGFGERIAKRPENVRAALQDGSAFKRALAIERFEKLSIPTVPFLDMLAGMATEEAKTLRAAASPLIVRAGAAAPPALRPIAETGTPGDRCQALSLIARLELPASRDFLKARAEVEKTASVRKFLLELVGTVAVPDETPPTPVAEPDIFAGVALDHVSRAALGDWAEGVSKQDLDTTFSWLIDPVPWQSDPPTFLKAPAQADVEGLKRLLARPELTPLHAVRLLRLAGLLQVSPNDALNRLLDFSIPREVFERLMAAYRDTHQPPMNLLTLAAAFRASCLDDELIARCRFVTAMYRRFDWDEGSTWPYFANRLDWLTARLDSPTRNVTDWDWSMRDAEGWRHQALAVIAAFPQPPARFVPRLWEIALGSSKDDRRLAQRSLEKLPDYPQKLFESLGGGKAQERIAAVEWMVQSKPEGAANAIREVLGAEKTTTVKAALAGALQSLEGTSAGSRESDSQSKDLLRAEAAKGLKKGIPEKYAWFPFDRLPAARWADNGKSVESDVLKWLVVSAWKTKSAEPTVLLRDQVRLLRQDDARRLGAFGLDAWLAEDLRPPTEEEKRRRLNAFFHWTGATTADEIVQKRPELAQAVEFEMNRPMSVRAEDKGILALVAACGPTDVVDRIRSYINQWYGYRAAQCRALIQVLAWTDHPEAVAFLLDVAKRFRTASIRQEAESQARKLAERKQTTLADLAEQSLPDAGFDAEGNIVLDFGPRKFIARLDDNAELMLEDQAGREIDALPAPGKNDDPELAAAAKKRLGEVKKELKAVRKRVVERLYEAMCTQRTWKFAEWSGTLLGHPIAGRLCCRVVWTLKEKGTAESTFRPLEDGTLTDLDDNEVQPASDAVVAIAHRLNLPYKTGARWAVHLADFDIEPLLPQLARAVFRLPKESRSATEWPLPLAQPQPIAPLTRRARGLGYDPAAFRLEDGGGEFIKHFPSAGLRAEIRIADFNPAGHATRLALVFRSAGTDKVSASDMRPTTLGKVPPVLLSECHADLISLGGGAVGEPGDDEEDGE